MTGPSSKEGDGEAYDGRDSANGGEYERPAGQPDLTVVSQGVDWDAGGAKLPTERHHRLGPYGRQACEAVARVATAGQRSPDRSALLPLVVAEVAAAKQAASIVLARVPLCRSGAARRAPSEAQVRGEQRKGSKQCEENEAHSAHGTSGYNCLARSGGKVMKQGQMSPSEASALGLEQGEGQPRLLQSLRSEELSRRPCRDDPAETSTLPPSSPAGH